MHYLFVFILPSFFGLKLIYSNIEKKGTYDIIVNEGILLLLSNLIVTGIVYLKNNINCNIVTYASNNIKFSLVYIFISILINIILGIIIIILSKYASMNVEVERAKDKKDIKKK